MSDVKLADLRDVAVSCRENSMRFEGFRQNALVSSLGWPDDVVEQFLYDHADTVSVNDGGHPLAKARPDDGWGQGAPTRRYLKPGISVSSL